MIAKKWLMQVRSWWEETRSHTRTADESFGRELPWLEDHTRGFMDFRCGESLTLQHEGYYSPHSTSIFPDGPREERAK